MDTACRVLECATPFANTARINVGTDVYLVCAKHAVHIVMGTKLDFGLPRFAPAFDETRPPPLIIPGSDNWQLRLYTDDDSPRPAITEDDPPPLILPA